MKANKNWKNAPKFEKKVGKNKKSDRDSTDGKETLQPNPKIQNWRNLSNIGASKKPSMTYQSFSKQSNPAHQKDVQTDGDQLILNKHDANSLPKSKDDSQLENIKYLISQTVDCELSAQEQQQLALEHQI
jgi:hypothetical protein